MSEKTITLSLRLKKIEQTIKTMFIVFLILHGKNNFLHDKAAFFTEWFDLTFHENESKTAETRERKTFFSVKGRY